MLKDKRVREAVAHALDLDRMVETVFYGAAKVSPSPVSVALGPFHDSSIKPRKFDVARSEKLLDEAGLPKKQDGMRVQLRLLINPFIDARLADFVRQSLRRVGIDAVIQPREFAAYVKQVYGDRQFDMIIELLANVFDPTVGVQRGYWSKNFKPGLPFSNRRATRARRRTGCSRPPRSRTIRTSARRCSVNSSSWSTATYPRSI